MTGRPVLKRKFAYIGAGWVAGLLLFLFMGLPAAVGMPVSLAVGCAVFVMRSETAAKQTLAARYIVLTAVSALAGALFFAAYSRTSYGPLRALAGQEVAIEGTVTDVSYTKSGKARLTIRGSIDGRRAKAAVVTDGDFFRGEEVSAMFRAEIPESTYSFDAEDYYRSLGVYLTGFGEAEKTGERSVLMYAAGRLRERTLAAVYDNCPDESGAFIASMLCADKSRLPENTRRAVYRAGIGHIFAVSGTHIVILAAFLGAVLRRLIVSVKLRSAVMGGAVIMFALFAGCSVSVMRACIMMLISLSAVFFSRESDSANSLGLSAFVLTLMNPFAVTSVSFCLSFTAAAAFGVLCPELVRGRTENAAVKMLFACFCVNVLSMPICAANFDEISVISAVSNILLIPLCTVCLYLAFIFMLTGCLFTPAITAASALARLVTRLCELVTRSPYSYVSTENAGLLMFWGCTSSAAFVVCALIKQRRTSDLVKCAAVYLLICVLSAML